MKSIIRNFILFSAILLSALSASAQKEINQYEPQATFERGVLLFNNKHYGGALDCFEQYLNSSEEKDNHEIVMAKYYEAASAIYLDKSKGVTKIINFVKENPTSIMADHANFLYANHLFKNRKYRNAIKIYEDINTSYLNEEEQIECKYKQGYCYYQTQDIEKASEIFKEISKQNSLYQEDAQYYYAHIQYANGNKDEANEIFNKLKESEKYKDISKLYLIQINYDNGRYEEVIKSGDEALSQVEKNRKADIALMMAESWFQQGDYAKSLEYYDIAKNNTRRQLAREVEFKIGFCKMKNNEFEDAITHFEEVTDKDDELSQYASYYMAQCYTNTHQDKFARNTFYKAYKAAFNDSISENALFNYAALSFIPGIDPFNEAITVLNDYIENNLNSERSKEAQEIVIHLLLNSKDYDNALKALEQYPTLSPEMEKIQSQLTYSLGIQYYNEAQWDEAINYLSSSVNNKNAENTTRAEATFWLADAYYQKKDYPNAYSAYTKFTKLPSSNTLDIYPLAYYNLGYILMNNADFNNASQRFKEYINYDKSADKLKNSDAWMRIGDCYFIQKQYNNAITSYSNATKLNSRNADYALYQQAMGYGALGKTNDKINSLNALTNNYKNSAFYDKALYETGIANLSNNDNRSAIVAFDKLIKERPRSSYARKAILKIGMIYYNNDENDKALERLKETIANYPNTEESREALNIISNIYRDNNDIQAYFDYVEENKLDNISIDEQDSLSFKTIEDFYASRKYNEVLKGSEQYIEKYPEGAYLLKVHYLAMKSMENSNQTEGIRTHIEYIINQADNDYTDNALLMIARMDYDESNYESAASHYERLINITENQDILTEASEGCMKSYYFNKQYDKAIEKANQLLTMSDISDNQKKQANYILGRSYFDIDDYNEAKKYFDICSKTDRSNIGAECAYYVALCLYKTNQYNEAEEQVFYVSDNFNSYLDWTARSFILLSDIYVAKDNIFQAKETLKSVIDNYPKERDDSNAIIKEAQEKLNNLNNQ